MIIFFCGSLQCATFFGVDVHDKNTEKIYTWVYGNVVVLQQQCPPRSKTLLTQHY